MTVLKFRVLGLALLFLTSCSTSIENSAGENIGCSLGDVVQDRPLIVASTVAPITSIIANIAGGTTTQITGVVPEGTNSHTFEPKPSDAAILESADVIFINGLVLEEPTKNLALANLQESANICELGSEILPESEYIYDFSFPKEGGKPNPHLWTNPPMAKQYAQIVRDVLVRRDPINATFYEQNFMAFAAKVDLLDRAMKVATETIPVGQRKLLTYHDAYAYFATHYGFEVVGAIQPSSFDEPTPKDIAELISQVKSQKVRAIFGSEVFPSTVLEQIGVETGVRYVDVLRDDDLIGEPGDAEHSWLGLMRFNFVTMVEALGGDASALNVLDVQDVVKDSAKYAQ